MSNNYSTLDTEELIKLSIDFIKVGVVLPEEIRIRLQELELLDVLEQKGTYEEQD